jgi:hypothetical protein
LILFGGAELGLEFTDFHWVTPPFIFAQGQPGLPPCMAYLLRWGH